MQEKIESIIKNTVIELKNLDDLQSDTILFGTSDALFDSIGLVEFLIELEEKLSDELGKNIVLADEKAMSEKTSPFINLKALARYVKRTYDE